MVKIAVKFLGDSQSQKERILLSRVPCVGELVTFNDEIFEVARVHHWEQGKSSKDNDCVAEIVLKIKI